MDIVFIEQLTVFAIIGVYDWEQLSRQKLVLDIEMKYNNKKPGASDLVDDCVNYAEVTEFIHTFVKDKHFALVEYFAEELSSSLLQQFKIEKVKIKVAKPAAIPEAKQVGVIIERP